MSRQVGKAGKSQKREKGRLFKADMRHALSAARSAFEETASGSACPPIFGDVVSMPHAREGLAIDMSTVTISPKFQVVIPQAIREALQWVPG